MLLGGYVGAYFGFSEYYPEAHERLFDDGFLVELFWPMGRIESAIRGAEVELGTYLIYGDYRVGYLNQGTHIDVSRLL